MKTFILWCIFILLILIGSYCANDLINMWCKQNAYEIAQAVSVNCPQSSDMNFRFECLYDKFGNGKKVPHIFHSNDVVNWKDIYDNIDYLLQ